MHRIENTPHTSAESDMDTIPVSKDRRLFEEGCSSRVLLLAVGITLVGWGVGTITTEPQDSPQKLVSGIGLIGLALWP